MGFGDRTAAPLRDYVTLFRGEEPGALFLARSGKPFASAGSLHVLLRREARRAGVTHVHPHRFRHTFATWAIESGAREIDVQMLLGHADLTMTQRYARTYTSEQAVVAHPALSPVNRLAVWDADQYGPSSPCDGGPSIAKLQPSGGGRSSSERGPRVDSASRPGLEA